MSTCFYKIYINYNRYKKYPAIYIRGGGEEKCDNKKKEIEQRKIIHKNSDIVIELERENNDSMIKLTLPNKETQVFNLEFNKKQCKFIEKQEK